MLNRKTRYLQIALNSTLADAREIIASLPASERILIEAGTPFMKRYGVSGIHQLANWWQARLNRQLLEAPVQTTSSLLGLLLSQRKQLKVEQQSSVIKPPYVVADLKTMDRGETEVELAKAGGASAAVALGHAPIETLNAFIENCEGYHLDAMVDMMNVEKPYQVLRKLKKLPRVIILHRGVDEEHFSGKPYPIHLINKIKGAFDVLVSVAGGDTPREIQSAVFNGADIVVLWKNFFEASANTAQIAEEFLKEIK